MSVNSDAADTLTWVARATSMSGETGNPAASNRRPVRRQGCGATMNFPENFKRIGSVNTDLIKGVVTKLSEESWLPDPRGQQGVLRVPLVYDEQLRHEVMERHPAMQVFEHVIRPVLAVTASFYDSSPLGRSLAEKYGVGYFVRAWFLRLRAGSEYWQERDVAFSETHAHRVHVPILANNEVRFTVGGETLTLPDGEVYEINNRRDRALLNPGDVDAVHLVLDYVLKGEACCCGKKHRPQQLCSPSDCFDSDRGRLPCTCYDSPDAGP